jgi:hypothetical protein
LILVWQAEDPVHGGRAAEEHRSKLVAVDLLGDPGAGVAAEFGDVLDPDAAVGEQRDEAVAQRAPCCRLTP